jgi:hypothetical protein
VKIKGYWNIYRCSFCNTEFAISQLTDTGDTRCPNCAEDDDVNFCNEDFVE